ncbi:MAG TPA: hypothetical protein VJJ82_03015 [Candidatus Nanoarchaeia archaeon]|nr:hypothetical protein [Candidatus Nanoarchaeia archaeon]
MSRELSRSITSKLNKDEQDAGEARLHFFEDVVEERMRIIRLERIAYRLETGEQPHYGNREVQS